MYTIYTITYVLFLSSHLVIYCQIFLQSTVLVALACSFLNTLCKTIFPLIFNIFSLLINTKYTGGFSMKRVFYSLISNKYFPLALLLFCVIVCGGVFLIAMDNLGGVLDFIFDFIKKFFSSLKPLILGVIFAYLIDPLVEALDGWLIKSENFTGTKTSFWAILLAYLIVLSTLAGILVAFFAMVLGHLPSGSPQQVVSIIFKDFSDYVSGFSQELYGLVGDWVNEGLKDYDYLEAIKSFSSAVINIAIGIIASIYIERDKVFFSKVLRKACHLTLSQKIHGFVATSWDQIDHILSKYIRGTIIDSIIISVLVSIFLFAIGVEFAPFLGLLMGLLNIIPYFGPFIASVPIVIMACSTGGLVLGIISIAGLLIIQQIDSNIIYPKVVGESTGLHPLIVLVSISFFGYFWGIVGMILAVPAAAILQRVLYGWAKTR